MWRCWQSRKKFRISLRRRLRLAEGPSRSIAQRLGFRTSQMYGMPSARRIQQLSHTRPDHLLSPQVHNFGRSHRKNHHRLCANFAPVNLYMHHKRLAELPGRTASAKPESSFHINHSEPAATPKPAQLAPPATPTPPPSTKSSSCAEHTLQNRDAVQIRDRVFNRTTDIRNIIAIEF